MAVLQIDIGLDKITARLYIWKVSEDMADENGVIDGY